MIDLRTARHQLGLSQSKLAAKLGVSVNTLARWERGDMAIQHPEMLELALEAITNEARPTAQPHPRVL